MITNPSNNENNENNEDEKKTSKLSHKKISWNDKIEENAKYIGDMSRIYKLMHIKSAQQSNNTYNIYMYLSIVIGPLAGILTGISSTFDDDERSKKIFTIIITVMSFISGIIAAIIKFGKFDEESSANKFAASRYTSLESNVRRQLSLYRKDRISSKDYIEWLNKSFDELFISSPLLPEYIYEKYAEEAEKQGIQISKYEKTININREYEEKKIKDFSNKEEIIINKNNKSNDIQNLRKLPKLLKSDSSDSSFIRHRTKSFSAFADLNKYDDSLMQYEIKRFLGFDNE